MSRSLTIIGDVMTTCELGSEVVRIDISEEGSERRESLGELVEKAFRSAPLLCRGGYGEVLGRMKVTFEEIERPKPGVEMIRHLGAYHAKG